MDGVLWIAYLLALQMMILTGYALYTFPVRRGARWVDNPCTDYTTSWGCYADWRGKAVSRQVHRAERRRNGFRLERLADPKLPRREAREAARTYQ